jgi:hypothetical protein
MARGPQGRPEKRPQIRLQSFPLAITSSPSDSRPRGDDGLTTTSQLTEESRYALLGAAAFPKRGLAFLADPVANARKDRLLE